MKLRACFDAFEQKNELSVTGYRLRVTEKGLRRCAKGIKKEGIQQGQPFVAARAKKKVALLLLFSANELLTKEKKEG